MCTPAYPLLCLQSLCMHTKQLSGASLRGTSKDGRVGGRNTLRVKVKFHSRPHRQINENSKKNHNCTSSCEAHLYAAPGLRDQVCTWEAGSRGWRCPRAQAERNRYGRVVRGSQQLAAVWRQRLWVTFCMMQFSSLNTCLRLQTTHPVKWRLLLISTRFQTRFPRLFCFSLGKTSMSFDTAA